MASFERTGNVMGRRIDKGTNETVGTDETVRTVGTDVLQDAVESADESLFLNTPSIMKESDVVSMDSKGNITNEQGQKIGNRAEDAG